MSFFLFLNSQDSAVFHSTNTADDFTISLPKPYIMEGIWECALFEMSVSLRNDVSTSRIHICTDVVEDSYVSNTMLPILRVVTLRPGRDFVELTYQRPFYFDVCKQEIGRIRLFIRDEQLHPLHSNLRYFTCVLGFRKKRSWVP